MKRNTARAVEGSQVGEPERESEVSGVRSNRMLVEKQTARVPRVVLDKLLAAERDCAKADSEDDDDEPPTLQVPAPKVPPDVPSPLGDEPVFGSFPERSASERSDLPPQMPELTEIMAFTRPPPLPRATGPFTPVPFSRPTPPPLSRPTPPPFEALRAARNDARRTRQVVIAIWAFAITLTSSLGYFIAVHG